MAVLDSRKEVVLTDHRLLVEKGSSLGSGMYAVKMGCLYILFMVTIQLAVASYYNPSELSRLAAYYSMYDIDMPEGLEMQLAAAMSGRNQGYQQQRQLYSQQYYQQKPTTRSQYNRQPVSRYPNNQQYRNTNNQQYRNANNQQYRNTYNQQYQNTYNQQYRNTYNQQYPSNQQYRNTNQQYRNTNNHQYHNQQRQQYANPNSLYHNPSNQYPRSRQQSKDVQRRGDAGINYQSYTTESNIPTTTETVPQFETSTPLPLREQRTTPGTLSAVGSVQAKPARNNNPAQSANLQHPKAHQKPSAKPYHWPNYRRNYQQRTTSPYNNYQRTHHYQQANQNYYRGTSNRNQNNYQSQNYNRYNQNNHITGYPSSNFLPYMAGADVFDITK
ncbi:hypothetical protein LOTGIDRAFT_228239 [Lottia gigantea]|uniref:Uncharacterized protein n=1 Tax=Lottia gigantea TaxID=225164 RepID=V4C7D8_LOTGI|nr:hypothetical protein LOTGIDRAFT_228239 [Lottia gigantea]ESO97604.1 hypothetical protein LOTGIDRAFT_228239 [Lottia gigantea]